MLLSLIILYSLHTTPIGTQTDRRNVMKSEERKVKGGVM